MQKRKVITILILFLTLSGFAQNPNWLKSLEYVNNSEYNSLEVDNQGNLYTVGFYQDPNYINLSSIQKYDPLGSLLWEKQVTSPSGLKIHQLTLDLEGNIYAIGHIVNSVNISISSGYLVYQMVVQKYDFSGNLLWSKNIGESNKTNNITNIVTDTLGNVCIAGSFGKTMDFDPSSSVYNLQPSYNNRSTTFVEKLDSAGNFIWAKTIGGTGRVFVKGVTIDAQANVYLVGEYEGQADFDPSADSSYLNSVGQYDIFIQKLDASGNFIWAKSMGGVESDVVNDIVVDVLGNVYTTGGFTGMVDFDPSIAIFEMGSTNGNGGDMYVQKLDSAGNFIWARSITGPDPDEGEALALDNLGNIYITGLFSIQILSGPNPNDPLLMAKGHRDVFLQKLDLAGNLLWNKVIGDTGFDSGTGIVVDAQNSVYVLGRFENKLDTNFYGTPVNITHNGAATGIFIHKLSSGTINSVDVYNNNTLAVNLYPSPTYNDLRLVLDIPCETVNVSVFNTQGALMQELSYPYSKVYNFSLDAYTGGVYFVRIQTEKGEQAVFKILK